MSFPKNRPISPHLSIYRFDLSMGLSIMHRMTGIGLAFGILVFAWWIIAAAVSPTAFDTVQTFLGTWIGSLLLFGWSVAFIYHLCNGIRHLLWDLEYGISIEGVRVGGWITLVCTAVLSVLLWSIVLFF